MKRTKSRSHRNKGWASRFEFVDHPSNFRWYQSRGDIRNWWFCTLAVQQWNEVQWRPYKTSSTASPKWTFLMASVNLMVHFHLLFDQSGEFHRIHCRSIIFFYSERLFWKKVISLELRWIQKMTHCDLKTPRKTKKLVYDEILWCFNVWRYTKRT